MPYHLIFPTSYLERLLLSLSENRRHTLYFPAGIHHSQEDVFLLSRPGKPALSSREIAGRCISVALTEKELSLSDWVASGLEIEGIAHLILGTGNMEGKWWGVAHHKGGDMVPIQDIKLVGSQMHSLSMSFIGEKQTTGAKEIAEKKNFINLAQFERWSRTIGALGIQTWETLSNLSFALVGCGRSGSNFAVSLIKSGVRKISLFDPDAVEKHNVPEMDGALESDIGKPKVEVLASFLKNYCSSKDWPLEISTFQQDVVSAYREALKADVIVCCADNDRARLACGILATIFHKILLDIGTAILSQDEESAGNIISPDFERTMGTDVRLVIPGHGCLRCFGSLANYDTAVRELARMAKPAETPWWIQRRGSLRSLNMTAVHLGLQMLFDFVEGRFSESRWTHLEIDEHGKISIDDSKRQGSQESCPLCDKAGMGDDGIYWK